MRLLRQGLRRNLIDSSYGKVTRGDASGFEFSRFAGVQRYWCYNTGAGYYRLHVKNASAMFIKATNTKNSYTIYLPIILHLLTKFYLYESDSKLF